MLHRDHLPRENPVFRIVFIGLHSYRKQLVKNTLLGYVLGANDNALPSIIFREIEFMKYVSSERWPNDEFMVIKSPTYY